MSELPFLDPPTRMAQDALPVRETSPDLIDLDRVTEHIQTAKQRERYTESDDPMDYLRARSCVVTVGGATYLTLTGLVCFGRRPQDVFPNAVIDLGHYAGSEIISQDMTHLGKGIGGTVFDQLAHIESYLWQNTHHGMTLNETSLQRVEVHEYPRAVIRELGVNMVAHRDYTLYASVARVQFFRDRIEWISPGGLPVGITVENILTEQRPRNPNIMRVLYDGGYVEAFGQGLDTVVKVLNMENMEPPQFQDTGASFIVTVKGRAREAMGVRDDSTELSDTQRLIYQLMQSRPEVTPREIRELLSGRAERSIQRDLRVLAEKGLIESTGGSRALRYHLVKGRK